MMSTAGFYIECIKRFQVFWTWQTADRGMTEWHICHETVGSFQKSDIEVLFWAAAWKNQQNDLYAQRTLRSAWASAQSDQSLHRPQEETLRPQLPLEGTVKTLIRLGRCPVWSESLLGTQIILLVLSCSGSFIFSSISEQSITSVAFNSTGDWIALGCSGLGQLLVWEWQSETYVMKQQGHFNNMQCLAYSPDGNHLATGGDDGKVCWFENSNCYSLLCDKSLEVRPGPLGQSDAPSNWCSGGRGFDPCVWQHSFVEIWSWNNFYGHSLSTAYSSRAVDSYWQKYGHLVLVNLLGKPVMPYANNKGADQPAHTRSLISAFVVHYLDSIIPLVSISEISSLCLASVAAQASLNLTWSKTQKTGFLVARLVYLLTVIILR